MSGDLAPLVTALRTHHQAELLKPINLTVSMSDADNFTGSDWTRGFESKGIESSRLTRS